MLCKRHCYRMKRQATNWKKIFANYTSDKGPDSRVKSSQSHKYENNPTKKMVQRLKPTHHQRRYKHGKFIRKKIFSITRN